MWQMLTYLCVAGVVLLFNLWVTIRAVAVTHQKQNRNRSQTYTPRPQQFFRLGSVLRKASLKEQYHEMDLVLLGRIKEVCWFSIFNMLFFHPHGLRNCNQDGSG
jgi:hypothetical protein